MNRLAAVVIALAVTGCNLPKPPPEQMGRATVTPPVIATTRPAPIVSPETALPAESPTAGLLASISADRLMKDVTALSAVPTRHVNSATVGDAATTIFDQFSSAGGRLTVAYDEFPASFNGIYTSQRNVVATLPGSDPAAGAIVIGAHYDSRTADLRDSVGRAPGANDNASGVAAALELARVMANERPRYTVMFVAFAAEEVGRQGSLHFVKQAMERSETFRGMIALDIVGSPAGSTTSQGSIRVFSDGPEGSPSRQLARGLEAQARVDVPSFEILVEDALDRPHRYSDHVSFSEAGFPAIRLIQPEEDDDNHSGLDTADHVDAAYLRRATQAALAGLLWMLDQR